MTLTDNPSGAGWPLISAAKLRTTRQLLQARGRALGQAFLAEGPQAVREALAWGDTQLVIVGPEPTSPASALAGTAQRQGVTVVAAAAKDLATITDTVRSQGIVAVCGLPGATLDDIVTPQLVLVLDEVRDPGNAGTLIRSADAFGAAAVLATPGSAEPWNPKAVRAGAGSVFHLPIVPGLPFDEVVAWAHGQGLQLLATATGGRRLDDPGLAEVLRGPVAWLFGNEAAGLPPEHLALADQTVAVPMWGRAESLNVAAAAAVCLYTTACAQQHCQAVSYRPASA